MKPLQMLYHVQFHGANRLADKSSRWYWVPALLILLASAIALVVLTIKRYLDNPTFMVQIEKGYIYKRFPCVTICPEITFTEDKMDQFLSQLKYPKGMTPSNMRPILPQVAAFYSPDMPYNLPDLVRVEALLDYNHIDVETAGRRITATCEETLIKCRWGRFSMNCSDIFQMELTGDGFCCVFNGRSLRRQMEERGTDKPPLKTQPDRNWNTKRFGYTSGLMLAVNQSQKPLNIDLSYKWMTLRGSQHFVDPTNNGTALNPGCEQWIAHYTRNFQIATGAKALSPALRQCNMASDKLKYFPMYNKKYCVLEYEIANTLKRCKCVRTVHPKPPGAQRCRATLLQCATLAMVGLDDEDHHCLRTCDTETDYIKASSYYLNQDVNIIDPFYNHLDYDKVTIVRIFISHQKQYTKERWSYYSFLDLFAQLGSMFGIFFGCSILTMLGLLQLGWRVFIAQCQRLGK